MPDVRVEYQALADMAKSIDNAAKHLDGSTIPTVRKVLATMQNGGLEGKAAEQLTQGFSSTFIPAITRLRDKMEEVAKDINDAASIMQQDDAKAAQGFH